MVPIGGRQKCCLMGVKFQIEVPTLTMYNYMIVVLSADQRSLLAYVKTGRRTRENYFSVFYFHLVSRQFHTKMVLKKKDNKMEELFHH